MTHLDRSTARKSQIGCTNASRLASTSASLTPAMSYSTTAVYLVEEKGVGATEGEAVGALVVPALEGCRLWLGDSVGAGVGTSEGAPVEGFRMKDLVTSKRYKIHSNN